MAITLNSNHLQESLANLLEQLKNKENVESLVKTFSEQVQDLENAGWQILETKDLNNATGQQLDDIGALVGELRSGRNDADYKLAIELRILINKSDGSIDDLNEIIDKFDSGLTYSIAESFPAALNINIIAPVLGAYDPSSLVFVVKTSRAGGIWCHIFYATAAPFQYDTAGGEYDVGEYATSVAA